MHQISQTNAPNFTLTRGDASRLSPTRMLTCQGQHGRSAERKRTEHEMVIERAEMRRGYPQSPLPVLPGAYLFSRWRAKDDSLRVTSCCDCRSSGTFAPTCVTTCRAWKLGLLAFLFVLGPIPSCAHGQSHDANYSPH